MTDQKPGAELAVLQGQVVDIAVYRAPEAVLEEARKAAVALQTVIAGKKDPVMMNGQQYLEYEDWQTVGRFYHITAKVEHVEFVQYGSVRGFSASAVALRSDGFELSRASADCLSDEEKWSKKAKYEWRDKEGGGGRERVKVGEEDVPLFQLKSMAQTRACAKALRNVLAWVVVLAGYRATPAEELDRERDGGSGGSAPASGSSGAAQQTQGSAAASSDGGTLVKDISHKSGGGGDTGKKEWTRWTVRFMDGRVGSTFSKSEADHAAAALAAGAKVWPDLKQGEKGVDLVGFKKPPKPAEKPHPEEPINGPENILTVRKIKTDAGDRFIIQTDKRELVTDKQEHADFAVACRQAKTGVIPKIEVMTSPADPNRKINRLLELIVEGREADAQAEPQEPKQPAKPKKTTKKKDREPGEEG